MIVVLGCIVGGLLWMSRLVQRRQGAAPPSVRRTRPKGAARTRLKTDVGIEVLSRRSLGQHVSLLEVRVGGRRFLVGQGAQQMTLLAELDEPEPPTSGCGPGKSGSSEGLMLAPRMARQDGDVVPGAWDAFLERLRELTVRR